MGTNQTSCIEEPYDYCSEFNGKMYVEVTA